jgi:tetratricopeptide (TPR) repeat protein
MKKLVCIGLWILVLGKYAGAQEQLSIRQQADNLYRRYDYFASALLYQKLIKKANNDVNILERIADCYRLINQYEEAEKWYALTIADPKASAGAHYHYAEILLRDQKFDLAKQQYALCFKSGSLSLARKTATCDSAALWIVAAAYTIKDHSTFSSTFSDWGLTYEGKTGLVFASDRVNDPNDLDYRTGNNWFKLYESDVNGNGVKEFDVIDALGKRQTRPISPLPRAGRPCCCRQTPTRKTGKPCIRAACSC